MAGGSNVELISYANVSRAIGTVISKGMATLHELQTVYYLHDVYNMLEISIVDFKNQQLMNPPKD